jgi:hypothetical protein
MFEALLNARRTKADGGIFSLNGNDYINHGTSGVTLSNKGGVTIGTGGYVFNKTQTAKLITNSVDQFDFQGDFRIEFEITHKVGSGVYFEQIFGTGDGINGNGWSMYIFNNRLSFGTSQTDLVSSTILIDTQPMSVVVERTSTRFMLKVRETETISTSAAILTKKHKQQYPMVIGDRQDGSAYNQYPFNGTMRRLEIFV